jgi:hypothetical protein
MTAGGHHLDRQQQAGRSTDGEQLFRVGAVPWGDPGSIGNTLGVRDARCLPIA